MKKLFAVLMAIFLLAFMACSNGGSDNGGSSSETDTGKSSIKGTWSNDLSTVIFMSDHTYAIDTNNKSGNYVAWGTYSTDNNQLTMTDSGGTSSCFNTASQTFYTGQYTYSISGNTLTLTMVSDNCSARVTNLSGSSLTMLNPPDTSAPSIPNNLVATAVSTSQINLTWSASSDNVAVSGYKVSRDGTLITTTPETVFSDTGLSSNTKYTYTVSAYDSAGNCSGKSESASATTLSGSIPASDFAGTWKGMLTMLASDGENGQYLSTMTLTYHDGILSGTLLSGSASSISGNVTNGVFYFSIPNPDSSDEDCDNWYMPATAIINSTKNALAFNSSGTLCGEGGGKSGTISGSLIKQ